MAQLVKYGDTAIFWSPPDFKRRILDSSGFSAHGTLIPHLQHLLCWSLKLERAFETFGHSAEGTLILHLQHLHLVPKTRESLWNLWTFCKGDLNSAFPALALLQCWSSYLERAFETFGHSAQRTLILHLQHLQCWSLKLERAFDLVWNLQTFHRGDLNSAYAALTVLVLKSRDSLWNLGTFNTLGLKSASALSYFHFHVIQIYHTTNSVKP